VLATDGALPPSLFAKALFRVTELVQRFQEAINTYTTMCQHRPEATSKSPESNS